MTSNKSLKLINYGISGFVIDILSAAILSPDVDWGLSFVVLLKRLHYAEAFHEYTLTKQRHISE